MLRSEVAAGIFLRGLLRCEGRGLLVARFFFLGIDFPDHVVQLMLYNLFDEVRVMVCVVVVRQGPQSSKGSLNWVLLSLGLRLDLDQVVCGGLLVEFGKGQNLKAGCWLLRCARVLR